MNEIGAERSGPVTWARDWLKPLQEALLLTIIAGGVGAAVNLIHPERIPFVAGRDYETMVPCPEPGGEVKVMKPNDPLLSGSDTFVVDARPAEQYAEWHLGAAMNGPMTTWIRLLMISFASWPGGSRGAKRNVWWFTVMVTSLTPVSSWAKRYLVRGSNTCSLLREASRI